MGMSFEEALEKIRKQFPEHFVTKGYTFKGKHVFVVLNKDYQKLHSNQACQFAVNDDGKVVVFDWGEAASNSKEFKDARESAIEIDKVDMTKMPGIWD